MNLAFPPPIPQMAGWNHAFYLIGTFGADIPGSTVTFWRSLEPTRSILNLNWTRKDRHNEPTPPRYTIIVLRVEGLGKRYGNRWLFRNLSFEVEAGQGLVILGANGTGKSTLLRTISGLLPPSEGTVHIEGDKRVTLGVSSIEMALYPQMTVAEHLDLTGRLRGCDPRTDELIERIGLEHARDQMTASLSTGMKARVKLAMAIQARPKVLLLDEPGAALDEKGRELVAGIATEQKTWGALVIATNDPQERRLATHELLLAA